MPKGGNGKRSKTSTGYPSKGPCPGKCPPGGRSKPNCNCEPTTSAKKGTNVTSNSLESPQGTRRGTTRSENASTPEDAVRARSKDKGVNVKQDSNPSRSKYDQEDTDEAQPKDKGVNVKRDSNPSRTRYDPSSLDEVEEELRQVIDDMEPKTPQLPPTSEAEEFISSISSSVLKIQSTKGGDDLSDFDPLTDSISISLESCHCATKYKQIQEIRSKKKKEEPPESTEQSSLIDYEQSSEHNTLDNFEFKFPFAPTASGAPPCLCPINYAFQIQKDGNNVEHVSRQKKFKLQKFYEWLGKRLKTGSADKIPVDLYKMNFKAPRDDTSPPRQLIFDLIENIPKPETNTIGTNTNNNEKPPSDDNNNNNNNNKKKSEEAEGSDSKAVAKSESPPLPVTKTTNKVDVYYFDHGNSAYFRTTDASPMIFTEILAEQTERYTTKFWANVFGMVHVGFSFVTSFILQLLRFILIALLRPLTVGILQIIADYFFKPLLTVLFNACIQPPLIFFYNICTSIRDICYPIAEGMGYYLREVAIVVGSFRLVETNKCNYRDVEGCRENRSRNTCECGIKTAMTSDGSESEEDNEKV